MTSHRCFLETLCKASLAPLQIILAVTLSPPSLGTSRPKQIKFVSNPGDGYRFSKNISFIQGGEGTLGSLLHWSQKSCNKVFLFVGFKTLGAFICLVSSFS